MSKSLSRWSKPLTTDPWIFAEHITISTQNGVVRSEGIVGDTGEMFRIVRLCRKIPGARRVIDEPEIVHNDPEGDSPGGQPSLAPRLRSRCALARCCSIRSVAAAADSERW